MSSGRRRSVCIFVNKVFSVIGELYLLQQVFGEITVTQVIAGEYGLTVPNWSFVLHYFNSKDHLACS